MLALYDLCAVLTPCGPLKALVNLMQAKDAPEMPGLLYEAHLPAGTQKPGATGNGRRRNDTNSGSRNEGERRESNEEQQSTQYQSNDAGNTRSTTESTQLQPHQQSNDSSTSLNDEPSFTNNSIGPHAFLPLAIARVYRLPLVSRYTFGVSTSSSSRRRKKLRKQSSRRRGRNRNKNDNDGSSTINESPLLAENNSTEEEKEESIEEFYKRDFSIAELLAEVEIELPRSGGRLDRVEGSQNRFLVIGRNGVVKRELYLNKKGKVYDVTDDDDDDSAFDEDPASIRLGLVSTAC